MLDSTLKNANILIVDDQVANIDVLVGLLEMQGYENLKTTTDPRDVEQLFLDFKPDLILLDLMMPYLNGFEVMERLNPLIPKGAYLPVLVLTADVTPDSKQRALANGASDFLTKPFDLIEVGLRIKNLLYARYLHKQLQDQNLVLEQKVRERTYELEKTNAELIVAKEKAEGSDRLKTSFINNISHEIRTPLNGILGFGQILLDVDLSSEEKEEYVSMLNFSSDRLINTVSNFIDISLLTSKTQEVNLNEFDLETFLCLLVEKSIGTCSSKMIEISYEMPQDKPEIVINSDKELLQKALFHLLDNAVKFTDQGFVKLRTEVTETGLSFFVEDSGKGISPDFHQKIFNSFTQEDANMTRGYEGSGLGLTIAGEIVELLGGKIEVRSEKEKGSTFFFSLPCLMPASNAVIQSTIGKIRKTGDRYKILVAEDDEFNFFFINTLFKNEPVDITHAENGLEAVEICKNNPEIDLVLMDLKMPVMNGFEATRQIKLFRNDLPIIAVTAYSGTEDRKNALMAGCDEFITKPVKKEVLFKSLSQFGVSFA